jgi:hypothetical protein
MGRHDDSMEWHFAMETTYVRACEQCFCYRDLQTNPALAFMGIVIVHTQMQNHFSLFKSSSNWKEIKKRCCWLILLLCDTCSLFSVCILCVCFLFLDWIDRIPWNGMDNCETCDYCSQTRSSAELCVHLLARIQLLPNIDLAEALKRVKEQTKCYRDMPTHTL